MNPIDMPQGNKGIGRVPISDTALYQATAQLANKYKAQRDELLSVLKKVDDAVKSDLWKCWHGTDKFEECNDLANEISSVILDQSL